MTLDEIRKQIDALDPQIRKLLMQRFDCGFQVAKAKFADHSTTVFRTEREETILTKLSKDVPEDRRAQYLAVAKKIMEANRMYQYGLLYDWNGETAVFAPLTQGLTIVPGGTLVKVRLTRLNRPHAIAAILSMIGDYGYDMTALELVKEDSVKATFILTIRGDLSTEHMKKLMFQLSRESENFQILESK